MRKSGPLDNFKQVCRKYLVMYDPSWIDVVCGVLMANRMNSKPIWLYLVGPPSSGKTEILQAFTGPEIVQLSSLSRNALISGYREKKDNYKDPSLLPFLNGKTLILKDFTALLCEREDVVHQIMGQLRDAYDGCASHKFGNGELKTYHSKFGIIAAVTNVIDRHQVALSALGERFVMCRMPEISKKEAYERGQCVSRKKNVTESEAEIHQAAVTLLQTSLHHVVISDPSRDYIIAIADYVARARCGIIRDPYSRNKEPEVPVPETSSRLIRQLCDLAIGIAVAQNKDYVDKEVMQLVQKTALDCISLKRLLLLKILYDKWPNACTVREIADKIRFSESCVRGWLDDLALLDLITVYTDKQGNKSWEIKEKALLKRVWQ